MNIPILKAQRLWSASLDDIIRLLGGHCTVELSNGKRFDTTAHKVIYSACVWEFYKRYAPNYRLVSSDFVDQYHGSGCKSADTHKLLIQAVHEHICDHCGLNDMVARAESGILRGPHTASQTIMNKIAMTSSRYLLNMDTKADFHAITSSPAFKYVASLSKTTPASLKIARKAFQDMWVNTKFPNNTIQRFLDAGTIGVSQLGKVLHCGGQRRELNGSIIASPILGSFWHGIPTLAELYTESRMAATAAAGTRGPIEEAGAASRRVGTELFNLRGVEPGDCGSKDFILWLVRDVVTTNGVVETPADLPILANMYHFLDDGTEELITKKSTHLIGKVIKLRSPLTCHHHDPTQICSKCYGKLAMNINPYYILGILTSTATLAILFQLILSQKHDVKDSETNVVSLKAGASQWFKVASSGVDYVWKASRAYEKIELVVASTEVIGLASVISSKQALDALDTSRSARLNNVIIRTHRNSGTVIQDHLIMVSDAGRHGFFTREMLSHISKVGMTSDQKTYIIPITGFKAGDPMIAVANRTFEIADVSRTAVALLEGSVTDKSKSKATRTPAQLLTMISDSVNARAHIPLPVLAALVYGMMVPSKDDLGWARGAENPIVGTAGSTTRFRSFTAHLTLRDQVTGLTRAGSFLDDGKFYNPLDAAFLPNEVVSAWRKSCEENHRRR